MHFVNFWSYAAILILYNTSVLPCPNFSDCHATKTLLSCRGNVNINVSISEIRTLEICEFNSTVLNLTFIDNLLPNLRNLTITSGDLKLIVGCVDFSNKIEVLKLNNLPIKHIKESVLSSIKMLRILDLRNNTFKYLHEEKLLKLKNNTNIYLSGNPWNCSHSLEWIRKAKHLSISDKSELYCFGDPFDGRPLPYIAGLKHKTKATCPEPCSCTLLSVTLSQDTSLLHPMVEVNCSHKNLTEFPKALPDHATKLILNQNKIGDLTPLVKNPIYTGVTDLFLDYNKINNIDMLEGTKWLMNFRILSLKGNDLTELPTYALANALQENSNMPNAVLIFLEENPWKCDCAFTPTFQEDILVKYAANIHNLQNIKCAFLEGDENSMLPIVQLSRASICHVPTEDSLKALNLLNGVLATLIVLILGKLAYDYYFFKKTGKLPWIVTRIP